MYTFKCNLCIKINNDKKLSNRAKSVIYLYFITTVNTKPKFKIGFSFTRFMHVQLRAYNYYTNYISIFFFYLIVIMSSKTIYTSLRVYNNI